MLYLKEFLLIIKENILLGLLFITTLIGLIFIGQYKNKLHDFFSLLNKQSNAPYFNALIAKNVNLDTIKRKIYQLPGVVNIGSGEDKKMKKELSKLEAIYGSDILSQVRSEQYTRLKIIIEESLQVNSQKLIQEYLTRLVGENNITIGEVRRPRQIELKKSDPLLILLSWSTEYLSLIVWLIYAASIFLLLRSVNAHAFIIEKFQRKSFVRHKIVLINVTALSLIGTIILYAINNNIKIYPFSILLYMLIILTPVFLLTYKKKNKI